MLRAVPLLLASLTLAAASLAAPPAPVVASQAWARPTFQGSGASSGYVTLTATEPLMLVGASTSAAGIVEIHQMKLEGDVMKMRAVDSIALAPGQPFVLKPGGYHFMLMDLKAPFKKGGRIALNLQFRDARGAERLLAVTLPVTDQAPESAR